MFDYPLLFQKESKGEKFRIPSENKKGSNEVVKTIISAVSILLLLLSVGTLILSYVNKDNVSKYDNEVKSKKEINKQLDSLKGDSVSKLTDVYALSNDSIKISYCGYYGSNVYVNINTNSLDDTKKFEQDVSKSYSIQSKSSETYNDKDGSVKYVTKYCLVSRG